MKAFWWFKENEIAGMARPGFNYTRWFDFSFEEAILVGWLGQHPSGSTALQDFNDHIQGYGSKILKFYSIDNKDAQEVLKIFDKREGLLSILSGLATNSHLLESYDVTDNNIYFEFNKKRLSREINFLKERGVEKIISLTENHYNKETLDAHFDTFHFSINDLDAPSFEQVVQLAQILHEAGVKKSSVAVHCLAGIGRTSTMLIGAHMLMGNKLDDLKELIAHKNPAFVFAGKQADFIYSLSKRLG